MTQYIVNLTNTLIGKHGLDKYFWRLEFKNKPKFIEMLRITLIVEDVSKMKPETLGRILCSLDTGDVMASKQELLGGLLFSGDPGETLRELVTACLAYVIRDRLDLDMADSGIPPYIRTPKRPKGDSPKEQFEIELEHDRFWCSDCNGDVRICSCP